jgi:hypothetical protein
MGSTNEKVLARYSFVYVKDVDGEWRIAHHHSSAVSILFVLIRE